MLLPMAFFLILGIFLAARLLEDSRVLNLLAILQENSLVELARLDASTNQRLEAVVLSIHGFLYNWLWPGGIDTYLRTRNELLPEYGDYFWFLSGGDKIMSWIGALAYELGIFGVSALLLMLIAAYDGTRSSRLKLVFLVVILLSAVPLAFPLVPMLLASMAAQKRNLGA